MQFSLQPLLTFTSFARSVLAAAVLGLVVTFALDAQAAGSFKMRSTELSEVSGAWHLYVTIELPKAPLVAHQTMKFHFTKTVAYERSLVDGKSEPVLTRQVLQNQGATIENQDVDFADPTGKIFKGTRFDFGLTRTRGYEAGEYKVELRTSDGVTIGSPLNLILKGDNEVVDRRSMAFDAKPGIKKVAGYDAGASPAAAQNETVASAGNGEVTASGTAQPFIPKEGFNRTSEEEIKTRPKGCGCELPGAAANAALSWLAPLVGGLAVAIRRRRRA